MEDDITRIFRPSSTQAVTCEEDLLSAWYAKVSGEGIQEKGLVDANDAESSETEGSKEELHLVGDGHAEAGEAGEGVEEGPQLIYQQRHIHRVHAGRGQRSVVQRRAAAVRHRVAHYAIHLHTAS